MLGFIARRPGILLIVPALPFIFYETVLTPQFPTTHGLFDDWANHAHRLTIFLLGYMCAKNSAFWNGVDRAVKFTALIAGFLAISGILMEVFSSQLESSAAARIPYIDQILSAVDVLYAWGCIVLFLGIAQRYFNRPSPVLRYLTGAVFCYYILHQTIIIVTGCNLTRLNLGIVTEFLLLTTITIGGCILSFELLKRIPVLRLFFGVQGGRTRESHRAISLAAAGTRQQSAA